jgi:glycine/D-amino acid oxidase-like deaminating enzyme
MERFPGFENLPEGYIGFIEDDSGVVKMKHALKSYESLARKSGASLNYNQEVTEIGKNHVVLKDGTRVDANHIVVTAGPQTILSGFDTD